MPRYPILPKHQLDATQKQVFENKKLVKRLYRLIGAAVCDYGMIQNNDKVMVCVSGGKDSYALLDILHGLQKRAPVQFELIAVHIDSGFPGHNADIIEAHFQSMGVPYFIERQDLFSLLEEKMPGQRPKCSLCARLRRGILYRLAKELKVTKVALGHHLDDAIETLFLNLFHGGKIKAMPPKLLSDDKHHVVIRPMAYCREKDLIAYQAYRQFSIARNDYCESFDHFERQKTKQMLKEWEKKYPGRMASITHALGHIVPSHLYDQEQFDFKNLSSILLDE